MADVDLLVRGVSQAGTTGTVTASSAASTAVGDYLLVVATVDWVDAAQLAVSSTNGVEAWGAPIAAGSSGIISHTKAWLARVTTGGARSVTCTQGGSSSGLLVHVYTLDPSGGTIVVDGAPAIGTFTTAPASHPGVTAAGAKDLLVVTAGALQYSSPFVFGAAPAGMTQGGANVAGGFGGLQSCYQNLTAAGSTGTRDQTWTPTSVVAGVRLMFLLRAEGSAVTAHQGAATLAARAALAGAATRTQQFTAVLVARASLTGSGFSAQPAAAALSARASLTAGGVRAVTPSATLHAPAALTVSTPVQGHAVTATLPARAAVAAEVWQAHQVSATLFGRAALTGAGLTAGGVERYTLAKRVVAPPARPQPTRVIAQDIRTGTWLHWDLEVHDLAITWTLSGPTLISGSFPVEIRDLRDLGLEAWGTWLYVEEDGIIRAAGILQPAGVDENETLTLDAVGISGYPKGIPYMQSFTLSGTDPTSGEAGIGLGLDPADIVRDIWAEVQYYPGGNLGVTVQGSTPVRLGTPKQEVSFDAENPDTGETEQVDFTAGPYSALDWFENADCGSEIEKLAKDTPFDFVERCSWNADRTAVTKWIDLEHPRIGRRLTEVRFAQEENLAVAVGPEEPDDRFASEVIVLGRGEGSSRVRGRYASPVPNRLRRVHVVDDKTVSTNTEANNRAYTELADRQALQDITELTALARHDNASLGEYAVGDDVLVDADVPWHGRIRLWQRVLGITYSPDTEMVKLDLRSASTFPQ